MPFLSKIIMKRIISCIYSKTSYCMTYRKIHTVTENHPNKVPFLPYDRLIEIRRNEAHRSIIVQVKSEESCPDLLDYCTRFGPVSSMHFYSLGSNQNYVVVEFKDPSAVHTALNKSEHIDIDKIVPVRSPLLWFRTDHVKTTSKNKVKMSDLVTFTKQPTCPPNQEEIDNELKNCNSFSDQLITLYNTTKLNDLGSRLRFFVARQLEISLSSMFPTVKVLPFGSSVNSFGKLGSDLDLVLQLDAQQIINTEPTSRLIFHVKSFIGSNRHNVQKNMEVFADLLQHFLPACSQVKRILNARVPIIKYRHDLVGLDCDLSTTNLVAVYMTELLYIYGSYDWRVCPLVFAVRYWAKEINLTNIAPGRWITNFSLTLLVLFYLQNVKIIPPLSYLVKHKRPEDSRLVEDGTDCSFLRDINVLPEIDKTDKTLFELLFDFFQFYSKFNFFAEALSLNTGLVIPKPEFSALYIINPLERHLNVSKNVSPEECDKLRIEFHNAAWILESSLQQEFAKSDIWGLLALVRNRNLQNHSIKINTKGSNRLMTVKDLFIDDDNNEQFDKNSKSPQESQLSTDDSNLEVIKWRKR